ncbi:PstS family phosphate ABC transporter substrate-binding protein [Cerasicoccus arenae]|uniref:Phosphate-binding protein n=1 Tax=Cerasicoccus arenae TaxID=424488 RepID=A0A8J3GD50_9BACT|nr:PstS family phosphate ABC transporter substrate-binding protein [Cerasicoccus arenae]MBK1859683.1 PstS family phosphate ABC transporter substrate-binding protein [Cerasicoccus arenae]GHB93023.1 phosphate-binding protein PstS [Cerasicoccus arenae]
MKTAPFSRLAQHTLLGTLGVLLIAGCTESTSTNTTNTSKAAAEPMLSSAPNHRQESQSYFTETLPPPVSTATVKTTVVKPITTTMTPSYASLPNYVPNHAVRGRVRSIGSDTMDQIVAAWEKDFKNYHQGIRVIHEGKGSSTAIPALVEGRSDFGPMSRNVKPAEVEKFKAQFGYEPTSLPVAIDALAVYVHPDNPIKDRGLSMSELDAIFSSTRRRGYSKDIVTWGDLGLTGDWANKPINVYSRNSASGTYGFFKDEVLNKGKYKSTNRELSGSEEVVRSVENDPYGIGYSGFGYKTSGVSTTPIIEGSNPIQANEENAVNGSYPLSRNLYLTFNQRPGTEPKTLHAEFIRYVYSSEGQGKVSANGYFPVSPATADQQLTTLGLH